jgi:hypothetical protein
MGTSHLNILLRDHLCTPITDCWMLDLAVQLCNGTPLYDVFPIVHQLKDRYSYAAVVKDLSEYPLVTDQAGTTLQITVSGGSMEELTFTAPAMTQSQIFTQIKNRNFTGCKVYIQDGRIVIETNDKGPEVTLSIGGSNSIGWAPVEQGAGYRISTRYYHSAYRINILPPSGQYINHIEMDVPVGCYKVFGRVCHGKNEDTSKVMQVIENCGECYTANLLLPEVMNCSRDVIYPLMHKLLDYQGLPDIADRAKVLQGIAYVANLPREQILVELADRKQDALDIDRTDLAAQVDLIIAIAQLLPQCC